MLINPSTSETLVEGSETSSKLIAGACAVLVAALLLGGYFFLRNRHARLTAASIPPPVTPTASANKGPAKLQVLINEPTLKSGQSLISGTVKNISNEELSGLSVELELWKRADSSSEMKTVSIDPATLGPNQEGRYAISLPAQQYASVRISGFRSGDNAVLAYSSSLGQKRPLEKTESKTIIVQRPAGRGGDEFINTPDNPGRVP